MSAPAFSKLAVVHSVDVWLPQTMTWLYTLVKSLPASIDPHVICDRTQNLDQFALPDIHALQGQSKVWDFIRGHAWRVHCLRRAHSYSSLGRAIGARILHSHFGPGGWTDLGHARRMGVKHVVTFYGYDVNHLPLSNPVWCARYREMFAAVDLVLCEGPHFARSVAALGCPADKIKVQHLGVTVGRIRFEPRQWQPGTPLRVLISATFTEKKGIRYALEALGELRRELPLEITVIGDADDQPRNREEKRRILATIKDCGLEDCVRRLGFRPHAELHQEAYSHHVFVSPSVTAADGDTEGGAPVTIIEMLATGMPVVSSLHCDIAAVVQNGVSGLLAPERDVGDLLRHLRWLTQNPARWQAMAQAGRAHVEAEFDAAVQGERLAAIYENLATERASAKDSRRRSGLGKYSAVSSSETRKGPRSVGVIALVPDEWEGVWMPRHQIISRLAGSFDVVWVTPPDDWREYWLPGRSRFLEPQRFVQIGPAFTVMQSGRRWPQIFWPAWLRNSVMRNRLQAVRRYLVQRGVRQIVLYLWRPEFAAAVDLVQHDASCYHIDDEYSFSDVELPNPGQETKLIRRVDQVIVHSIRLMEKKGTINPNTALVPNGVDYEAFANPRAEPPDLARVRWPRIGYVGVIKKQLDLALLLRLARARGDWNFVMVGPVGTVTGKEQALAELQALPNVHFLGEKPVDALSAYTQHVDVCLMCYEVNDYTKYIYPMKLHEYLASGRPVVATPIDSVVEHGDLVALAQTDSEWIAAIEQALLQQEDIQRRTRQDRARAYDWNTLAARVGVLILQRVAPAADLERKHNRGG